MTNNNAEADHRVAVLVDCDNTSPEILEYALRVVAQFGRVVLRRGYGNHTTLANQWQEALVRMAFTPCLQFQYASGKNTSDIALALDAIEAMFDNRADMFCLVTSDCGFAHLCRKQRERGATVHIVGEAKTPDALRNASDRFFEWQCSEPPAVASAAPDTTSTRFTAFKAGQQPSEISKTIPKRRPRMLVEAIDLAAGDTAERKVDVGKLWSSLKRMDQGLSASHLRILEAARRG